MGAADDETVEENSRRLIVDAVDVNETVIEFPDIASSINVCTGVITHPCSGA